MAKKVEFNMDAVKKYLFWVCTPIGLILAVVAGWMAIGSVANELETQKKQLDDAKTAMSRLRGEATTHPNQGTIDGINELREKLAKDVLAAWEVLVEEQQKRNRWTGLATVAVREIEGKNFLDLLSSTTRQSYLLFARNAIDGSDNRGSRENRGLLEYPNDIRRVEPRRPTDGVPLERTILTATSRSGSGGSGTFGARSPRDSSSTSAVPGSGPAVLSGKVVWNTPDLDFTMKDWSQQRYSFEVWLTQEDLWVYQALLWVIAESNKDVRENSVPIMSGSAGSRMDSGAGMGSGVETLNLRDSRVKEIIDLAIGSRAAVELQRQLSRRFGVGGVGSGADSSISSFSDSSSSSSTGGFGGGSDGMRLSGAAAEEAAQKAAMAGRYVDTEGAPLIEPDLTGQFRRMPIYLNLRVDQRSISDVLVNCANCPMPIDVLWVIVNPDSTQSFDFVSASGTGTTSGSASGFGSSGDSGRRSSGGLSRSTAGGGATRGGSAGASGNVDFGPHAVTVEIFGCINIFAPPDPAKIGGGT